MSGVLNRIGRWLDYEAVDKDEGVPASVWMRELNDQWHESERARLARVADRKEQTIARLDDQREKALAAMTPNQALVYVGDCIRAKGGLL